MIRSSYYTGALVILSAAMCVAWGAGCSDGSKQDWNEAEPGLYAKQDPMSLEAMWRVLETPDEVRAYLLDPDDTTTTPGPRTIGLYEATKPGPVLTTRDRRALIGAMRAVTGLSVGPGPTKTCEPRPYVGIRFAKGEQVVDVCLCFECSIWVITANYRPIGRIDENFDAVEAEVIDLVQELFPEDEAIQRLEARPARG